MNKPERRKPGAFKEITSLTNPIVKDLRGLTQRKNRQAQGLFLAEGLKLVASAVESGWEIETFVFGRQAKDHPLVGELAAKTKVNGGLVLEVSNQVLEKISRKDNPQMVIGVFRQMWAEPSSIKAKNRDLWVALEGVKDPGNLGTVIRTCDAAGAKGIVLIGETTDPFALEAVRATMGSVFALPIVKMSATDYLKFSMGWDGQVVGTHLSGETDYREQDYNKPTILLMGNEQSGLSDEMAASCTSLVKIPQAGNADSLNLAIATALMVFEVQRDVLAL